MAKRTCTVDGCDRQRSGRGLCRKHYMAQYPASRPPLAPDDPRHGTHNGYGNHACRCEACRAGEKAYQAAQEAKNREARAESKARHYQENREKFVALGAAWEREHPRSVQVYVANRRAGRAGVSSDLTIPEWESIWASHGGLCAYCGSPAAGMDHVLALSRGGANTAANVVPACLSCNASKKDQLVDVWLASRSDSP